MLIRWFGQSAFCLRGNGVSVFIDPFGMVEGLGARGMRFDYPRIEGVSCDLLLITHEHFDHNAVEAIQGSPVMIRSTAGTFDSPTGQVVAVASEHDQAAGTQRGPNTIFVWSQANLRVCHFGDFGQLCLRPEQVLAIGDVDLLFLPVGAGPTMDAAGALEVVRALTPRWVVPMHYRTAAVNFLEPPDAFVQAFSSDRVHLCEGSEFDTDEIPSALAAMVVVPAVPQS